MDINAGKYVVYRSSEVCRIVGTEKKSFDGKTQREYCVLLPLGKEHSTYYLPRELADEKLRDLLTKEQIDALIDSISEDCATLPDNGPDRRSLQNEIMAGSDYARILSMLRALYRERQERSAKGKHLTTADERAMKAAEALINSEFGFVLGIGSDKVEEYIAQRRAGK